MAGDPFDPQSGWATTRPDFSRHFAVSRGFPDGRDDDVEVLFITQGVHRIEAGGMPSRNHASDGGRCSKRDGSGSEVERIAGRDPEEQ